MEPRIRRVTMNTLISTRMSRIFGCSGSEVELHPAPNAMIIKMNDKYFICIYLMMIDYFKFYFLHPVKINDLMEKKPFDFINIEQNQREC